MRTIIWSSMLSVALLAGAGCKKKEGDVEGAKTEVRKAQEDVRDEQKDVNEAAREGQKDVADERKDVVEAKQDLAKARVEFETAVNERMARLDAKIDQLEKKGDANSREAAVKFRARRDDAKVRMGTMGDRTEANWEAFKTDVSTGWDQLEKDVDAAL